ncbi:MAG: transporter [Rubripirellula sp.]|nr:transporter [Rubripirellula sp.]
MKLFLEVNKFTVVLFVAITTVTSLNSIVVGQQPSTLPGVVRGAEPMWVGGGLQATEPTADSSLLYSECANPHCGKCCKQHAKPQRLTCRSFLFTWPCQDSADLRLDLCDPLVTDRPDFTEASSTVGRGVTQFELGYTYFSDKANGTRTQSHSYPEVLLRQGVFRDWLELRVAYNAASVNNNITTVNGSEDLYIGAKIGLTPQDGWLPEMSILPQATLDTGSAAFTDGQALFGTNWLYSWELNDSVSLAGSTQFNRTIDSGSGKEYTQWAQSIASGKSITDEVGCYLEWYAFFPDNADTDGVEHYLNGGFTYLISDNIQWDVRAGFGLNEEAEDFLTGTGLSIRFR